MLSTSQTPLSVPISSTSRDPNVFVEREVKMVLSRIVDKVVKLVDKVTNLHESHSATLKAKVLNELLYMDKSQYAVAKHFKINQAMVSK